MNFEKELREFQGGQALYVDIIKGEDMARRARCVGFLGKRGGFNTLEVRTGLSVNRPVLVFAEKHFKEKSPKLFELVPMGEENNGNDFQIEETVYFHMRDGNSAIGFYGGRDSNNNDIFYSFYLKTPNGENFDHPIFTYSSLNGTISILGEREIGVEKVGRIGNLNNGGVTMEADAHRI